MPANDQVRVIAEDGAGVAGVFLAAHDLGERIGHNLSRRMIQPDDRKVEERFDLLVEGAEFGARRLKMRRPAATVNRSERCELVIVEIERSRAPGVVGRPVTVEREDEVVRDDNALVGARGGDDRSEHATRQAGTGGCSDLETLPSTLASSRRLDEAAKTNSPARGRGAAVDGVRLVRLLEP